MFWEEIIKSSRWNGRLLMAKNTSKTTDLQIDYHHFINQTFGFHFYGFNGESGTDKNEPTLKLSVAYVFLSS